MKIRFIAAAICALTLAACAESPTVSAAGSVGLRDGGLIIGSGHHSAGEDTTTTNNEPAKDGGLIIGSGH